MAVTTEWVEKIALAKGTTLAEDGDGGAGGVATGARFAGFRLIGKNT